MKNSGRRRIFKWVDFKYECFLNFCYLCYFVGYLDKDCFLWDDVEDELMDLVYGEWMWVSFIKCIL